MTKTNGTLKILAIASGVLLALISAVFGYGKLWVNVSDMKPAVRSNSEFRLEAGKDIIHINEKLDRLMLESRTSTEVLLAELRRINANQ